MMSDEANLEWQWGVPFSGIQVSGFCGFFGHNTPSAAPSRSPAALASWWSILTCVGFNLTTAMSFYTSWPLAWNGLTKFWIGVLTLFIWLLSAGSYMAVEATRRSALADGYVPQCALVSHGAA